MVNVKFSKNYYWVVNEKEQIRYDKPLNNTLYSGSSQNYYSGKMVLGSFQGFNRPIEHYKIEGKRMPDTITNILMDVGFIEAVEKKETFIEVSEASNKAESGKIEYKKYSYKFKFHVPLKFRVQYRKWVAINENNNKIVKTVDTILYTKDETAKSFVYEYEFPKDLSDFTLKSKAELEAHYEKNRKGFLLKVKKKIFDTFLYHCKKEFISKYIGIKSGVVGAFVFVIKDKDEKYSEVNELEQKFKKFVAVLAKNTSLNNKKNWHDPEAKKIIEELLIDYTTLCESKDEKFTIENKLCFERNRIVMLFFDSQFELAKEELNKLIEKQNAFYKNYTNKEFSRKERKKFKDIYYFMKYKFKLKIYRSFITDYEKRYNVFKDILHWV
jgi:hypothetical protein